MKTPEEIEKLSEKHNKYINEAYTEFWVKGYSQCQQDNCDKKYTEEDLHTILRLRREWYSHTDKNVVRDFLKELNTKD